MATSYCGSAQLVYNTWMPMEPDEMPEAASQMTRPAGFWVRSAATVMDIGACGTLVWAGTRLAARSGLYIPLELTTIFVVLASSVLLVGLRGRTLGKKLLGLKVLAQSGKPAGCLRSLLRETIAKAASVAFLMLGVMWIGFTRRKRGWHDMITKTCAIQDTGRLRRARWVMAAVFAFTVCALAAAFQHSARVYLDAIGLRPPADAPVPYGSRDSATLWGAGKLTRADDAVLIKYLKEQGKAPIDYAVQMAASHDVTVFSEIHEKREYLDLLNRLIPELYDRAGVTCVAMEVCPAEDNARLERLVTGETFDEDLAMRIARDSCWEVWGWKEYWDVLRTVWELNHSLSEGQPKMRLVGINFRWDGPSLALVAGDSGDGPPGPPPPPWELLRVFRVATDMPALLAVDEIYARNVEREIIEKGERGIVWVGAAHAPIRSRYPVVIHGQLLREFPRMAFMLHHRYGDRICHIKLHDTYSGRAIGQAIERAVAASGITEVAFDIPGSPWGRLRDEKDKYYRGRPGVCFEDLADGYIFLKPFGSLTRCEWQAGFISREMFGRNKPFYELMARKKLDNAEAANDAMASGAYGP